MDDERKLKRALQTRNPYISLDRLRAKLGGRSRSSIYRDVQAGRLPKPIKRGAHPRWVEEEVDAALERLRINGPSKT